MSSYNYSDEDEEDMGEEEKRLMQENMMMEIEVFYVAG